MHSANLQTSRLNFRPIIPTDIDHIFKGLSNPDVIKYYGVSFNTLEETSAQMRWFEDLELNQNGVWWAICSKDNGTFYGAGGFNNLSNEHHKSEIGFWLLPEFWGKGYMKEAFPVLCDFGFNNLGLHRIEGFVETENKACRIAVEKLGFQLEGIMKDCEIKNGNFISIAIYAKLKDH